MCIRLRINDPSGLDFKGQLRDVDRWAPCAPARTREARYPELNYAAARMKCDEARKGTAAEKLTGAARKVGGKNTLVVALRVARPDCHHHRPSRSEAPRCIASATVLAVSTRTRIRSPHCCTKFHTDSHFLAIRTRFTCVHFEESERTLPCSPSAQDCTT